MTLHFAVAFVVLGVAVAITASPHLLERAGGVPRLSRGSTAWTAAATYALLLVGTYVRAEGAGLAFRDWPLMGGRLVPALDEPAARRDVRAPGPRARRRRLRRAGAWSGRARCARAPRRSSAVRRWRWRWCSLQIARRRANVLTELAPWARAAHVGAVGADLGDGGRARGRRARGHLARRPAAPRRDGRTEAGDGAIAVASATPCAPTSALTKPRIIVLLLITTVPAMILAAGGMPSVWLILATLIGGTLAAGSANAINMYLDRDIDQVMRRTRQRPLPRHAIEPERRCGSGSCWGPSSFAFLALTVNVLAAVARARRRSPSTSSSTRCGSSARPTQNIVIGGAAGAVPGAGRAGPR